MPKQTFSIRTFTGGLIADADQEDVPAEAAVYTENIDPDAPTGLIRGVRGDSVHLSTEIGGEELLKAGHISVNEVDWTVLLTKSGSNCKFYVYDGTTVTDVTPGTPNYSGDHDLVVIDKAAFIGTGGSVYWVGNLDGRKQFASSGSPITHSGWSAERLAHSWDEGLSMSQDAPSGLTTSNPLATRGDSQTHQLTLKSGTTEEQRQVSLTVEPEGQELAGIEKVFIAASPVYDGYINGPLDALGNTAVAGTKTFTMKKDLDALDAGEWYYTAGGGRVKTTISGTEEIDMLAGYSEDLPVVNAIINFKLFVDTSALSDRVTAIDLYAATATDASASDAEHSYRFVKQIHLNDSGWSGTTVRERWEDLDLLSLEGPTFSDHAGVAEEVTDPRVDWRLATAEKNRLYVTLADSPTGASDENWSNFMVRSKPYQYGIFDWSKDFLVLPIEPNAVQNYGGRVYAFTDAEFVRINPGTLEVEDRFRGAGAMHHRAVISTQRGLFFANADNCFHFDGAQLRTIGDPIRHIDYSEGEGWAEAFPTSNATVISPNGDLIVFAREPTSGNTKLFVWDTRKEVWYIVVSDFTTLRGAYTYSGQSYISGLDGASYKLFQLFDEDAARRSWTWVGQKLAMGRPQGRHKVYEVRLSGDPATVRLAQDAEALSGTSALSAPTLEKGYQKYELSSYQQGSRTQVRIEGASSDELRGCSIIYRPIRTP